jgi:hypothetical protein
LDTWKFWLRTRRRHWYLLEVGPQPHLVVGDDLQLVLLLADVALRLGDRPAQLQGAL